MTDTPFRVTAVLEPRKSPTAADWNLLSPSERERAERYRDHNARATFVSSRSVLRRVLGKATGEQPARLTIMTTPMGKPYLPDHRQVEFSLTHSGWGAAVAIAEGVPVGIDIECHRPGRRCDDIANRFFHPSEQLWMQDEPLVERFLTIWTRKEATLKAHGAGLRVRLEQMCCAGTLNAGYSIDETGRVSLDDRWFAVRSWTLPPVHDVDLALISVAVDTGDRTEAANLLIEQVELDCFLTS